MGEKIPRGKSFKEKWTQMQKFPREKSPKGQNKVPKVKSSKGKKSPWQRVPMAKSPNGKKFQWHKSPNGKKFWEQKVRTLKVPKANNPILHYKWMLVVVLIIHVTKIEVYSSVVIKCMYWLAPYKFLGLAQQKALSKTFSSLKLFFMFASG